MFLYKDTFLPNFLSASLFADLYALLFLLKEKYSTKKVILYIDFDSLSQGDLTKIYEELFSSMSFKALLSYDKVTTTEIGIFGSNCSLIKNWFRYLSIFFEAYLFVK